jgi:hypothetical protein
LKVAGSHSSDISTIVFPLEDEIGVGSAARKPATHNAVNIA